MVNEQFSIKNNVFAITGATGYLGSQMTRDLISLGAKVAVLSTHIDKAKQFCKQLDHENAAPFCIDIADNDSVEQCFQAIYEHFGSLDVLINNAYYSVNKDFFAMHDDDWNTCFDGTVKASHRCISSAYPWLRKSSCARIINIASMYGMVIPDPAIYTNRQTVNPVGYGVGKAALIHYSKYAAMRLAESNITVNTISYGPFPNPDKITDSQFLENLAKKTVLKRIGQLNEVSAAIVFLALPASSYMTGQNIVVDGGWTTW